MRPVGYAYVLFSENPSEKLRGSPSRTPADTAHDRIPRNGQREQNTVPLFPSGTAACSTNRHPSTSLLPCFLFRKRGCPVFRQTPGCFPGITPPRTNVFRTRRRNPSTNGQSLNAKFRKRARHCGLHQKDARTSSHPPHPLPRRKQKDTGENDVSRPQRPGNDSESGDTAYPAKV